MNYFRNLAGVILIATTSVAYPNTSCPKDYQLKESMAGCYSITRSRVFQLLTGAGCTLKEGQKKNHIVAGPMIELTLRGADIVTPKIVSGAGTSCVFAAADAIERSQK